MAEPTVSTIEPTIPVIISIAEPAVPSTEPNYITVFKAVSKD